jgi:hypothetical protein
LLRAHRNTFLEQHQTEKTETKVRDIDNSSVVDPDPNNEIKIQIQIRILIRIKIYKLDLEPDPHQFADVKPKCTEYEPILEFFQVFKPFFEARFWIRIRIRICLK